ncbi:PucR-like helix-turn-helix protein [Rhodococcus wratislaviensis]|uniref:CdaR family transcriptional regulator n=1 Tax=Rhodococcus wratislaviensis TaxID=44752 RepID=A0AB38F8P6_RHOWR|nr:helix-turn-helix domain-containing protein [Rhodococcus wratislaviensis]REE73094.1 PucR-like helix-turn-helix protein [Rhodococcus wratislaviensis]SPZ37884.1 CdaR family transcriptional regulator [Rhodococcus wratislaviensis]
MKHYQHNIAGPGPRPDGVDRILSELGGRIADVSLRTTRTAVTTMLFPPEIVDAEMPAIARRSFPLVLASLRTGSTPGENELAMLRDRAAQRAREGVPLTLLLHIWQHGFQEFFEESGCIANTDETKALTWIGRAIMRLQEIFLAEMVTAYQGEQETLTEERSGAVPLIARLLLLGQDPRADAERLNIALAECYDVLAVRLGSVAHDGRDAEAREVAERRRLHRMLALLRTGGGPATLSMLDRIGGYVLVPRSLDAARSAERLDRFVAALESAAGSAITAAVVEDIPIGGVTAAARQADEVLDLVRALDRSPRLYRLSDVFMAHQLSRPGPGVDHLVAGVEPVLSHDELRTTLQTYFDCDLDRQRTARRLGVHPNTVNNRLNRIAEISPHSPFTLAGITALSAALTVERLRSTGPPDQS